MKLVELFNGNNGSDRAPVALDDDVLTTLRILDQARDTAAGGCGNGQSPLAVQVSEDGHDKNCIGICADSKSVRVQLGGVGHLGPTIDWALAHLDEELTVGDLAAHARMSRRNFTRRFAEATGTTPARWVLARRLDEARRLLETTAWPVTRIVTACGFTSVVTFRQNLSATYATTPTSYRQRFSASLT